MIKKTLLALSLLICVPAAAGVKLDVSWKNEHNEVSLQEFVLNSADDCAKITQDNVSVLIVAVDDTGEQQGIFKVIVCGPVTDAEKSGNDVDMVVYHTFDVALPWGQIGELACGHSGVVLGIMASKIA